MSLINTFHNRWPRNHPWGTPESNSKDVKYFQFGQHNKG